MRIAILGATSQIAKDLVLSFSKNHGAVLTLFARRLEVLNQWMQEVGLSKQHAFADIHSFGVQQEFDAVINFVGVGKPAQTAAMGSSIMDITLQYDEKVLAYLRFHPACRYIFLSSGAVYGSSFHEPVTQQTKASVAINHLLPHDWYAIAKLHAECRHRAMSQLAIFDVRVFNYFSRTQDMDDGFLITDIVRAIRNRTVLKTSSDYMVRDYLHPEDLYQLIQLLLVTESANGSVDCYTKAPIEKPILLARMQHEFGLQYELRQGAGVVNGTGAKPHYYSMNRRAAEYGYVPRYSSLEGLMCETQAYLERSSKEVK